MLNEKKAAEREYFGKKIIVCLIKPEDCPFGNSKEIKYGGEILGNICKTKGLVEMVDKHPEYNLTFRKSPKFYIEKGAELPAELI